MKFGQVLVVVGVVAAVIAGLYYFGVLPPQPATTTELEIEINGGFAYIPEPNDKRLAIAYLNSYTGPDCSVPQIGTELMVVRGVIDAYQGDKPMPPTRIFNLDKAQVRFQKLPNDAVNYPRQKWKPTPLKTANHGDPAWLDNQYVPKITDHQGLTTYTIKNKWRNDPLVNGYMELQGGKLEGAPPSDPIIEKASFRFEAGGVYQDTVSGTDKTIYRVSVPDDKIEIHFTGASEGYKRLVIKPPSTGGPVRLRLRGLHAMGAAASLADGDELKDFCVFHQLLDSPPTSDKWLKIYYKAPALNLAGVAMPSPGFFCEGGSF